MEPLQSVVVTLQSLLIQLPILVVWLVIAVIAILRRQRHPKVSLFVVLALVIFLMRLVAGTWLSMWMPMILRDRDMPMGRIGAIMGGSQFALSLVGAAAWGLIAAAIFRGRQETTS